MPDMKCNCRKAVNTKIDSGELRQSLARSSAIPPSAQSSLVDQALRRSRMRGRCVLDGVVRQVLNRANWDDNEIDFLFYRSLHFHQD